MTDLIQGYSAVSLQSGRPGKSLSHQQQSSSGLPLCLLCQVERHQLRFGTLKIALHDGQDMTVTEQEACSQGQLLCMLQAQRQDLMCPVDDGTRRPATCSQQSDNRQHQHSKRGSDEVCQAIAAILSDSPVKVLTNDQRRLAERLGVSSTLLISIACMLARCSLLSADRDAFSSILNSLSRHARLHM